MIEACEIKDIKDFLQYECFVEGIDVVYKEYANGLEFKFGIGGFKYVFSSGKNKKSPKIKTKISFVDDKGRKYDINIIFVIGITNFDIDLCDFYKAVDYIEQYFKARQESRLFENVKQHFIRF